MAADDRPFFNQTTELVRAVATGVAVRCRSARHARIGRVGQHDDVPGRAVPSVTIAWSDSSAVHGSSPNLKLPRDGLGQLNVVGNDAGGGTLEEVDQVGLQHARPRPSADRVRVVANARVVDFDENDVVIDRRGIGDAAQRPVVEPQVDFIEASELRPGEEEDDERGACAEQQAGDDFTHRVFAPAREVNA